MNQLSITQIVRSLGRLSKKWLDRSYRYRKLAVARLVKRSGYTKKMAEALIDALFSELTAPKLRRFARGRSKTAQAGRTVLYIFAANVPNPAVDSFVRGMLCGQRSIGKVSSRDPGILDIYLRSVRAHDARLAAMNRLLPASDRRAARAWMRRADTVVVYGDDATVAELKKQAPKGVRFVGHGHRFSIGVYAKEALRPGGLRTLARKTAYDIWMADQRGCLSPLAVYLETRDRERAGRFGACLKEELEKLNAGGRISAERAIREFRLKMLADVERLKRRNMECVSAGAHAVRILPFTSIRELERKLARARGRLQGAALEAPSTRRKAWSGTLTRLGLSRICRAGELQRPPLSWQSL